MLKAIDIIWEDTESIYFPIKKNNSELKKMGSTTVPKIYINIFTILLRVPEQIYVISLFLWRIS